MSVEDAFSLDSSNMLSSSGLSLSLVCETGGNFIMWFSNWMWGSLAQG